MLPYAAVAVLGYLVGSIPTAYLIVMRAGGKDLRREGSGNIGALNAYEVSRSRRTGLTVLALDLAKGALPVALLRLTTDAGFALCATAMVALVVGHCWSPWIGFRGGRGLATAAGACLFVNPLVVLLWAAGWTAAYAVSRHVHVGNLAATVLAPAALAALAGPARWTALVQHPSHAALLAGVAPLFLVILVRHAGPLRELLAARRRPDA